jgi:hypothetical protein
MARNSEAARQNRSIAPADNGATIKDPADLHTANEAITASRVNYLKQLSAEAGEAFDPDLSKAMAARSNAAREARPGKAG